MHYIQLFHNHLSPYPLISLNVRITTATNKIIPTSIAMYAKDLATIPTTNANIGDVIGIIHNPIIIIMKIFFTLTPFIFSIYTTFIICD